MKVVKQSSSLSAMYSYRLIFIDDHSCGVPTTVRLQSLQTDDSSIQAGKLRMIVKLVFANSDILAMISGGIMRMNGLWTWLISRLSSARFFSSLASSLHRLQEVLFGDEILQSTFCGAATESLEVSQCL